MKKAISKIAKGAQRQEGITWYNELSDKGIPKSLVLLKKYFIITMKVGIFFLFH